MTERRNFTRKSGFRDARLIVIATEGEVTEKLYFDGLKENYDNPRVHVEVLDRIEPSSDPARVIKALDKFRSTFNLRKGFDHLWLAIDVDRWRNQKLSLVSQQCIQKDYHLAISNPAFEIWLLLHLRSLDSYSSNILQEFLANRKTGNRTRLEQELINLLGSYNKTNLNMEIFCQYIITAIKNARIIDTHPENRWPNELGTRVYLLVEQIISSN